MTVAEGLVMMWLADALDDMAESLQMQSKGKTLTVEVERIATDGQPVLRLRVGAGGSIRIEIREETGGPDGG